VRNLKKGEIIFLFLVLACENKSTLYYNLIDQLVREVQRSFDLRTSLYMRDLLYDNRNYRIKISQFLLEIEIFSYRSLMGIVKDSNLRARVLTRIKPRLRTAPPPRQTARIRGYRDHGTLRDATKIPSEVVTPEICCERVENVYTELICETLSRSDLDPDSKHSKIQELLSEEKDRKAQILGFLEEETNLF
jgi:hypothetical protein